MNRRELVNAIAAHTGQNNKDVDAIMTGFTEVVTAVAAVTYKKLNAERLRLNPKRLMLTAFLIDQIGKGERNDRFGLGLVKAPPRSTCTPQMQPVAAVVTAPVHVVPPPPPPPAAAVRWHADVRRASLQ